MQAPKRLVYPLPGYGLSYLRARVYIFSPSPL